MKNLSVGTKFMVICQGKGRISWSQFSRNGCCGGIGISQIHLVITEIILSFVVSGKDHALTRIINLVVAIRIGLLLQKYSYQLLSQTSLL